MISTYRALLLTPTVLRVGCATQVRGIKKIRKVFRQNLPKYRNDLSRLPPLTKLLIEDVDKTAERITAATRLRQEKLEIYKQYMPDRSNFILIEALFAENNNDIDELLRIVDCNLITMNSFYIGVSFEVINDMIELGLCDPSTVAVAPEFKRLCEKAMFKLRFFESDELLKLIKCLSSVGVPGDALIVQGALQMVRHLINDFEIQELEALANTLNRIECENEGDKKSLITAIKKAIPITQQQKSDLGLLPAQ